MIAAGQLDLFAAPRERRHYPVGHVVHMSLDHSARPSVSVAECDCGWQSRVNWLPGLYRFQDDAIEQHWSEVEK